ncbi:hypothetical protein B0H34DRAFT_703348 [Crassisporium funariophilum]|nr:hypothetical protein B0H34DRAFT_703348 [Crassisporium funariophilum]
MFILTPRLLLLLLLEGSATSELRGVEVVFVPVGVVPPLLVALDAEVGLSAACSIPPAVPPPPPPLLLLGAAAPTPTPAGAAIRISTTGEFDGVGCTLLLCSSSARRMYLNSLSSFGSWCWSRAAECWC